MVDVVKLVVLLLYLYSFYALINKEENTINDIYYLNVYRLQSRQ